MKITVRCFYYPTDITFNTDDILSTRKVGENGLRINFKGKAKDKYGNSTTVDKWHYLDEKSKK